MSSLTRKGYAMTRKEMNEHVAGELEHIPNGPGEHQGVLRFLYNGKRRWSLAKKATSILSPNEVLQDCIAVMRQSNPAVQVYYDRTFFERN